MTGLGKWTDQSWLGNYLHSCSTIEREQFARNLKHLLGWSQANWSETRYRKLWTKTILPYLDQRTLGLPRPLDHPSETAEMLHWLLYADRFFPLAVSHWETVSAPHALNASWYHKMAQTDYAERFPQELSRLLLHLLSAHMGALYGADAILDMLRRSDAQGARSETISAICDQLIRLGVLGALTFQQDLEAM